MKKIVVDYDETNNYVLDKSGVMLAHYDASNITEFKDCDSKSKITLELVKQGLTADEIVKLKNADLL